jgi:hypothetical protein
VRTTARRTTKSPVRPGPRCLPTAEPWVDDEHRLTSRLGHLPAVPRETSHNRLILRPGRGGARRIPGERSSSAAGVRGTPFSVST